MGVLLIFSVSCNKDNTDKNGIYSSIPVLTISEVTNITQTTAQSGGIITSNGGLTITVCGVCWSTSPNPSISDNTTTNGTVEANFISSISGLSVNTPYYVRAYARNSKGTGYSNEISFTTLKSITYGSFTDSRDNNVYKTVTIGTQVWMAENLKYLPSVVGPETETAETPCHSVYGYYGTNVNEAKATANYSTYGVLYNWPAAMNSCPSGWHLPGEAEWTELTSYLGGGKAGGKLKETGISHWKEPNVGATNESGFTALPAGHIYFTRFDDLTVSANWWTSTLVELEPTSAYNINLIYVLDLVAKGSTGKGERFSVRCVKD